MRLLSLILFLLFTFVLVAQQSAETKLPVIQIQAGPDGTVPISQAGVVSWGVLTGEGGTTVATEFTGFVARASNGLQTVPSGTWTKVVNYVEDSDPQGRFNSGRYTVLTPGFYEIKANVQTDQLNSGNMFLTALYVNGNRYQFFDWVVFSGSVNLFNSSGSSSIVELQQGDYIEVFCFHNKGSNITINRSTEAGYGWFSASLIQSSVTTVAGTPGADGATGPPGPPGPNKKNQFSSYTELRNSTQSENSDVVHIQDFTYVFDGVSYTTFGGDFARNALSTANENGGTVIVASDGTRWLRQWDGITAQPEWWVVGGNNTSGTVFTSYNAGNGIADDGDRVAAASIIAGAGGTVELRKNYTYDVWQSIPVYPGQKFVGNNAVLRRGNVIKSVITANVPIGATTIDVADASRFRPGQRGVLLDRTSPLAGREEFASYNLNAITSISGNKVNFFNGADKAYTIGDTLFVQVIMVEGVTNTGTGLLTFERVNFDGNVASNNLTYGWTKNTTLSIDTDSKTARFYDCTFYNTPTENMFVGKVIMERCSYSNLGGSLVHFTSSVSSPDPSYITNTWGNNANLQAVASGHSEGVITLSANSVNINLSNCRFTNTVAQPGVGPLGIFTDDDKNLVIENCYFENFGVAIDVRPFAVASPWEGLTINNSQFINCKELRIRGAGLANGNSISRININNTKFVNTRSYMTNVSDVVISGCQFEIDEDYTPSSAFTGTPPDFNQPSFFTIANLDRVRIDNCIFRGPEVYNSSAFKYGVVIANAGVRNLPNGTPTKFRYGQDIFFTNNTVENFKFGVSFTDGGTLNEWNTLQQTGLGERECVGVEVSGNKVFMTNDVNAGSFTWGILAIPGMKVMHNEVYAQESFTMGIVAFGVHNVNNNEQNLIGPIVTNNVIHSSNLRLGGLGVGSYNIIFKDNIHTGSILYSNQSTVQANSIVSGNTLISSTTLPALTNRTPPVFRSWKESRSTY